MAVVKRARTAQWPLVQEFVFNYNDGVVPLTTLSGASVADANPKAAVTDLGSKAQPTGILSGASYTANANTGTTYIEALSLPQGAQIISGELIIEAPYVGPSTATLAVSTANGLPLLAATSLKATDFTNQPATGGITNATAGDPTLVTIVNATANGLTAVGQLITISGCTGAGAPYNGTFVVESYSATGCTVRNPALTTSLTNAGTPNVTFITGRVAFNTVGQITAGNGAVGQDAAAGYDVRLALALSGGQAATQGRARVRVMYTIDGRSNEVQPN